MAKIGETNELAAQTITSERIGTYGIDDAKQKRENVNCTLCVSVYAIAVMFNGPKIVYAAHGLIMSSDKNLTPHIMRAHMLTKKKITTTKS